MNDLALATDFTETFREFLARRGMKTTRQREVVAEAFATTDEHVSAEELYRQVTSEHPGIGYATVYRTLRLLTEAGLAAERHFGEGFARYEPLRPGHHHDHLICVRCRTIVEFENADIERLQDLVAERRGFVITHHRLELYGLCADCRRASGDA